MLQEHTQKESGAKSGGANTVDLVSYVEYQRNHRLVLKTHKDALYAMRHFWQCLLHSKVGWWTMHGGQLVPSGQLVYSHVSTRC
jgi:hypothetical protein